MLLSSTLRPFERHASTVDLKRVLTNCLLHCVPRYAIPLLLHQRLQHIAALSYILGEGAILGRPPFGEIEC